MNEVKKLVKCLRCGYHWEPRFTRRPKACPDCKRRDWDKEKSDG